MSDNGNEKPDRIIGDGPGINLNALKRKSLGDNVFETSLTIEQCKAILRATRRHSANFRPVSSGGKVATLIEAMRKDQWVWTDADPIRLHLHVESGEIVASDGQHRLYAAIRGRRVLRTLVLWGDQWRAGVHVDRNTARSVAQFLQHEHGLGSATIYVAAARLHLGRVRAYSENLAVGYSRNTLTDEEVIAFVLDNQERLRWAINHGAAGAGLGFSMTGYLVFLFELSTIRDELAEQFHADLVNRDLPMSDPLAQLRRSVGRRYTDTGIRSTIIFTINNLTKAHNLRSAGDTVNRWVNVQTDDVMFPAGFRINGERIKT